MRCATAVVACALAVAACGKGDKKGPAKDPDRPPPMAVDEVTRNADGCKAYAEQVCACAAARPDAALVVEMCKTDRGLVDALALTMTLAANPETKPDDVLLAQTKARKIATQCMDQLARLPALGCAPPP